MPWNCIFAHGMTPTFGSPHQKSPHFFGAHTEWPLFSTKSYTECPYFRSLVGTCTSLSYLSAPPRRFYRKITYIVAQRSVFQENPSNPSFFFFLIHTYIYVVTLYQWIKLKRNLFWFCLLLLIISCEIYYCSWWCSLYILYKLTACPMSGRAIWCLLSWLCAVVKCDKQFIINIGKLQKITPRSDDTTLQISQNTSDASGIHLKCRSVSEENLRMAISWLSPGNIPSYFTLSKSLWVEDYVCTRK